MKKYREAKCCGTCKFAKKHFDCLLTHPVSLTCREHEKEKSSLDLYRSWTPYKKYKFVSEICVCDLWEKKDENTKSELKKDENTKSELKKDGNIKSEFTFNINIKSE